MLEVLKDVNKEVGVMGSLVLTTDGIVIASLIGVGLQEDAVAARSANAIRSFNKELSTIGASPFSRLVISSAHGKMVFIVCGDSYLVVVLDKHINADLTLLSIASASRKIRNMTTL